MKKVLSALILLAVSAQGRGIVAAADRRGIVWAHKSELAGKKMLPEETEKGLAVSKRFNQKRHNIQSSDWIFLLFAKSAG